MAIDPITSFVVRYQHVSQDQSSIKVKLTHVQENQELYFDQLEEAFEKMKEIVQKKQSDQR